MTDEEKKIPDNVVPHPNALPYASDLAAPVIKPDHSLTEVGNTEQFIQQTNITQTSLMLLKSNLKNLRKILNGMK